MCRSHTTLLTVGADFLIASKMPLVPIMAGSRRSYGFLSSAFAILPASANLLYVLCIKVERTGRVDDCLEWWIRLDCLIESPRLRDIFHNHIVELGLLGIRMRLLDFVELGLAANSRDNRVSILEQSFKDVGGDETRTA